jgi:hypothetical protein
MAKPKTYYRATLETRHFDFEVTCNTAQEAKEEMLRALQRHARDYNVSPIAIVADYGDSIEVRPLTIGTAYRGREEV